MRKLSRWLSNVFTPKELHGLDVVEILAALNEEPIRKQWIYEAFQELKRMNLEIDKRLLNNVTYNLTDLAARRKAYQDILEGILSAKRMIHNHNPKSKGQFDLESVTGGSSYV
jgi:tryptophanyl-tRNA synthetase